MSASLKQAQRYAQLKGSKVIEGAYHISDDEDSITFVMASGPKLTFTETELEKEIKIMEKELEKQQSILAVDSKEQPAPHKSKSKEK